MDPPIGPAGDDASSNLGAAGADMSTDLTPRIALIALVAFLASPAHAQPAPGQAPPNAVSIEQSAVFDVTPVTGALKETAQKGQQLVWRARRSPNDRRFALTEEGRRDLEKLVRTPSTAAGLSRRARAVLLMADGMSGAEVARRCGYTTVQVSRIRRRVTEEGVPGIFERPRGVRSAGGREIGFCAHAKVSGRADEG